ncbi:hypothetical protein [Longibacter sp.]|jgi:hypothetical protein|uniref:hypothetical protein n=1 Tax=Longibacter sp. TaxID=2045415 RepID=UPI003EB8EABC
MSTLSLPPGLRVFRGIIRSFLILSILVCTGAPALSPATAQADGRLVVDSVQVEPFAPWSDICPSRTGSDATLIFPHTADVAAVGMPVQPGDELAVFTPSGQCAGHMTWTGDSVALTVWGDDPMTDEVDGMKPGQNMHFRIRRSETSVEYTQEQASVTVSFADHEPYLTHTAVFVPDGIYIIRSLTIGTLEHAEASEK